MLVGLSSAWSPMVPALYAEVSALVSVNTAVDDPLTSVAPATLDDVEMKYVPPCCVVVVPATNKSMAGWMKVSLKSVRDMA